MENINALLSTMVGYVWGLPLVILLGSTGVLLTLALGGIQFREFFHALKVVRGKYDDPSDPGEISHFQALCTAVSATVGLGNIAGVAVAIQVGGPGATFWMIATGLLGMVTKFAECTLSVQYRRVDEAGVVHGGPMYYIERGLGKKWKPMALFFALACAISSFGIGNLFQSNQVASILNSSFAIPKPLTGIVLGVFVAIVILGGIRRIARVASVLVPVMALLYVGGAVVVLALNFSALPPLIAQIFHDAFTGTAVAGGAAGIALRTVILQGVRRACFSNEAGLGSAPFAHSAVATKEPVREGLVALLEPFIDTVVICTLTALVILVSGQWTTPASGVDLTASAFDSAIPGFGAYFVPIAVLLFAYSTTLSWSYYGERAMDYLCPSAVLPYKILYCIAPFVGAVWKLGPIIDLSDILLGLMVVPNLIAVLLLLPKIREATKQYFHRLSQGEFS